MFYFRIFNFKTKLVVFKIPFILICCLLLLNNFKLISQRKALQLILNQKLISICYHRQLTSLFLLFQFFFCMIAAYTLIITITLLRLPLLRIAVTHKTFYWLYLTYLRRHLFIPLLFLYNISSANIVRHHFLC